MNPLHLFFHWPDGGVWSNIVASMLWVVPGYLWGRFHVKRISKKVTEIHNHLNPDHPFTLGNHFKIGNKVR